MRALVLMGLFATVAGAEPVTIVKKDDTVEFRVGGALVSKYHVGPKVAKPFFWPMLAPGELPVTRAWPMLEGQPGQTVDHVHQKSAWFCHGDVVAHGIEPKMKIRGVEGFDFWAEFPGHGVIACVSVGEPATTKQGMAIDTKNEWRTPEGTKIMSESRRIELRDLGNARLFILEIDLHADVCDITFADTKEGSLGIRINDVMSGKPGNGIITNAEGKKSEKEVWGFVSPWCDYSGKLNDKACGIAIFDDTANGKPVAWHSRAYGLMAANPFGREKSGFPSQKGKKELIKLAKGEHLTLRYGILVHAGDVMDGKVAEHYKTFLAK